MPRSAAIQPLSPSVSGRTQPKWSAESRETSSPLRTVAASRRPTSASTRSPARRPCSALICLKPSMLIEDERERALVALRAPRLGAQLLVEGAVVGKVRELVARCERAELGARVGERDRRAVTRVRAGAAGRRRRPRRRARPRGGRRCGSARLRERPCRSGRPSRRARRPRAGLSCRARDAAEPRGSQAPTIVPKPPVSKRTTAAASTPRSMRGLLGDDGEQLDGIGLERDRILDPLLGGAGGQSGRAAEDGDDAGDEAELVAAGEPAAFEHDVGSVLVRVPLRAVRGREQVVRVQERVDLDADELRGRVAEQLLGCGRARPDQAVAVDLEDERVARVRDEPARLLLLADRGLGAGERVSRGLPLVHESCLERSLGGGAPAKPQRGADQQQHQRDAREGGADRCDRGGGGGGERDAPGPVHRALRGRSRCRRRPGRARSGRR